MIPTAANSAGLKCSLHRCAPSKVAPAQRVTWTFSSTRSVNPAMNRPTYLAYFHILFQDRYHIPEYFPRKQGVHANTTTSTLANQRVTRMRAGPATAS